MLCAPAGIFRKILEGYGLFESPAGVDQIYRDRHMESFNFP